MEKLDKNSLYRITKWFSKDCEEMINKLEKFGLAIVKESDLEKLHRMEDDLK